MSNLSIFSKRKKRRPAPARIVMSSKNVGKAMNEAVRIVKHLLTNEYDLPPAAVFDIDETLLINEEGTNLFRANKPVLKAARELHKAGCTIFAVTARSESPATEIYARNQLKKLDCPPIERIYAFPPEREVEGTASQFKWDARKSIGETHTVLLNTGDQCSDMFLMPPAASKSIAKYAAATFKPHKTYLMVVNGDAAKLSVKLPNRYVVA